MHCMKCGRQVEDSHSFCLDCLEEMEKYPVKPGTVVKLPDHPVAAPTKKRSLRRKRPLKPEDQIAALRRSRRRLLYMLMLSLLALLGVSLLALFLLEQQNFASIKELFRRISAGIQ